MFVFVCDTPKLDLVLLVQRCKPQICEVVEAEPHPALYVFISSEPAISVFYSTRDALEQARTMGNLTRAHDSILSILEKSDQYDSFSAARVTIRFLDAETDASKLYGLSRED